MAFLKTDALVFQILIQTILILSYASFIGGSKEVTAPAELEQRLGQTCMYNKCTAGMCHTGEKGRFWFSRFL